MLMGALMVAACATDSESVPTDWGNDADAVRIAASVNTPTRTNPEATDVALQQAFVAGDRMEVSATDGNTTETVNYQYSGTQWQPIGASYLAWHKKWSQTTFNAFYPADGSNTFAHGHIAADQSTAAKMSASDYMKASKTYTERPSDRLLRLDMQRQTSRLILRIKRFGTQFDANPTVDHVRIVSNDLTTTTTSQPITISPLQNGEGAVATTYTALVAPGASKVFVYLTNDPAESPLTVATGNLDRGTSYTYDLVVGKDKIEIDGITINNWTDGNDIGGGKAEENHDYITFTANAEQTFKITQPDESVSLNLEYSLNNGDWKSYAIEESVTFGGTHGNLRLRGINAEGTYKASSCSIVQFGNATPVACSGDIRTLVDYRTKDPDTKEARFQGLFRNCTQLTTAPKLPATTLANACYRSMFNGCTSLTQAPDLPATTLADECYQAMFLNCAKISSVTMLSPSDQLTTDNFRSWLSGTGTDATSRTLKVKNKDAYDKLKNSSVLPDNWQIGGACTVKDANNVEITE